MLLNRAHDVPHRLWGGLDVLVPGAVLGKESRRLRPGKCKRYMHLKDISAASFLSYLSLWGFTHLS